jgi:hypothetical protein
MTILGDKKKYKWARKQKAVIQEAPIVKNALLDTLFTFIGVSSEYKSHTDIMVNQMKMLNLYSTTRTNTSRLTAGTTDALPGANEKFLASFTASTESAEIDDEFPELLPVSCGYFSAIVEELMEKKRLMTLKYVLVDTEGSIFNRLAGYI